VPAKGAQDAVGAVKPVVSGFDPPGRRAIPPFCLQRAMADHRGTCLIEGLGGIMVPLDDRRTVLDLMSVLRIPVILVAGSYVGTISHTLTALEVMARRNLDLAAVVVSESEGSAASLEDTVAAIAQFADAIDVVGLPRRAQGTSDHAAFAQIAGLSPELLPRSRSCVDHGSRMLAPVVLRLSRSRCAFCASFSGYFWFTGILTAPLVTTSNRSFAILSKSSRLAA
jgi:hypothetical protein